MPDLGDLRDQLIIETKIDDQATGAAGKIADALDRLETTAGTTTKAVAGVTDALGLVGAEAEAAATAQAAWNGSAQQGAQSAESLSATLSAAAQAAAAVGASADASQLKVVEASRQFAQMATRVDDISRAAGALETVLRRADAAHQAFAGDLAKGIADVAQGERVFDAFGASITNAAQKLATLTSQRGLSSDATTGLTASLSPNAASAFTAAQADQAAKSAATLAGELDNLRASIDPVYASSKRYEAQLDAITDAQARLGLSAQQVEVLQSKATTAFADANKPLDALKGSTEGAGEAFRQTTFIYRELANAASSTAVAIASGVPAMTIVEMESARLGTQLLLSREGFKLVREEFGAFFTAIGGWPTVAAAAIVGGIGAIAVVSEASASRLATLRDQLSATRTDFLAVADSVKQAGKNIAASTPASSTDATAAAQTIASNPLIDASTTSLTRLGQTAQGLSQVIGKSIQDTAQLISDAATDPTKVAVGLASSTKALVDLDAVTLTSIIHMQQMGDTSGATAKLMAAFGAAAQRAKDDETPLGKALLDLTAAMNGTGGAGKSLAQNLGEVFTGVAAYVVDFVTTAIKQFQDLRGEIAKLRADTSTSGGQLFGGALAKGLDNLFGVGKTGQEVVDSQLQQLQQKYPSLFQPASAGQSVVLDQTSGIAPGQQGHGVLQVTPDTAAARGLPQGFIDQNTAQNLVAGLSLINSLFQQGRDATSITQAFGGFSAGNTAGLASKTAKLNAADIGKLPTDVQGGIAFIAQLYGWPDWLTKLAMQTAVVESSGQQFGAAGGKPIQTVTVSAQGPTGGAGGTSTPADATNAKAGALAAESYDQQAKKLADLNKQLVDFTAARSAATVANNPDQVDKYNKLIEQTSVDINAIIHPTEAATKATQDQGAVASLVYEADKKRAEGLLAIARQREENPLNPISDADAAAQISAALSVLSGTYKAQVDQVKISTDEQNKLAAAWTGGAAAAADVVIQEKAHTAAVNAFGSASPLAAAAANDYAAKLRDNAKALNDVKLAQDTFNNTLQAQYVQAEITSLGQDDQARQVMLAHLQAENTLRQQGIDVTSKQAQEYLASVDTLTRLNAAYQQQQSALQGLANLFSQSFDTIGNAMAQAFVQGQGQAVNWGNVMKSVVQQVIQQFAKLAILNPILNSAFGQNNATLGSTVAALGALGGGSSGGFGSSSSTGLILGALAGGGGTGGGSAGVGSEFGGGAAALGGGSIGSLAALYAASNTPGGVGALSSGASGGGGGSSGGGAFGLLSNAGSLFSVGKALFPELGNSSGNFLSGITNSIGLTGPNGLLNGATSFLNTPLIAPGIVSNTIPGVTSLGGLGADAGSFGSLAGPAGAAPGATLGGVLGAAGAGYGVGSLVGGFVQSSLNKTGPGPEVGAALGTAVGIGSVLLAPETFGTSLLIGGLIGGALGGAGGGLIGPHPASPFSSTPVNLSNGLLSVGGTTSQRVDASGERAGALSDVDSINQLLQSRGLTITSLAGPNTAAQYFQVGQNTPGGFQDPSKFASVSDAFPNLRFASNDPTVQAGIAGRSFASPDELGGVSQSLSDFEAALKGTVAEADTTRLVLGALAGTANSDVQPALQHIATFVTSTLPSLTAPNPGTLATTLNQINAQFSDALDTARTLGVGVDQLTTARDAQIGKATAAVNTQLTQSDQTVALNYQAAAAQISGSLPDQQAAGLASFDAQADQQRQQLKDTLTGIYGDAYATSADYATRVTALDRTLAEQRLAIVTQNDQALAAKAQADADLVVAKAKVGTDLQSRYLAASATISGSPQDAQASTLYAFDASADQQRQQFHDQLTSLYGSTYDTTSDYAAQVATLETTLGQERLAIVTQYAQKIAATEEQLYQQGKGLGVQASQVRAQISGSPADANKAAYDSLEAQYNQQQTAVIDQYKSGAITVDQSAALYSQGVVLFDLQKQLLQQQEATQAAQNAQTSANLLSGFGVRYQTAAAQVSGNPADQQAAQLAAFDVQATQEQQQLHDQLVGLYGKAYDTTADYAAQITALEKAQGEERLAIIKQFNNQLTQQATTVIQSLNQYALSLQTSTDSPLSPTAQLSVAKGQFDTISGKAAQGDYASIQQLQTASQAYLGAARNVYGSGTGYVDAFSKVIDALGSVANQSPDVLTASILKQTSQTQTDALVTQLQSLNDEVHQLRLSVVQGSTAIPIPSTLSPASFVPPAPANDVAAAGPIMMLRPGGATAQAGNAPPAGATDIGDALAQVVTLLTAILQTLALNGQTEGDSLDQLKAAANGIAKLNTTVQQAANKPTRDAA